MKKSLFPIIALFIGVILLAILMVVEKSAGEFSAPLLMLLFMSELGFFVTGGGAFLGTKIQIENGFDLKLTLWTVGCAVLAVILALRGYEIWSHIS